MPQNIEIPDFNIPKSSKVGYLNEARGYIKKHFPDNYGEYDCIFPFTHQDATRWLKKFVKERLSNFGNYQDSIKKGGTEEELVLFHSGISAPLNIGLLTPVDVIDYVIKQGTKLKIPINNIEGFIRQILGWREQCRLTYYNIYDKMTTSNYFGHKRKLSKAWYTGETGCLYVDECIKKAFKYGYLHHIERLMIVGQFMLLCEIDPVEVYKWFMEFAVDSYDWVMIYNVFSMSQYADGGLTTTKPYISSSNYIVKMSDYKPDSNWDSLYWYFIYKHSDKIKHIPRISFQVSFWNKKTDVEQKHIIKTAKEFINHF
jgi:deoxyribodipyrimidine photolyase-related protein